MPTKKTQEERIVLIDLDNTVFNNLYTRQTAIKSALKSLNLKRNIKKLLNDYEQIVDLSDGFEAIGLTNFKHVWNSNQLYAILTILFTKNDTQKKKWELIKSIKKFS